MLINAILGLSIYMTLNCGLFSLANAGFMAVGAYVSVILTQKYDAEFGLSLLGGALAAGLVAIPIGLPVLRLRSVYLAIATIGFGEIVRIVVLNVDTIATDLFNPDEPIELTFGARGISRIPKLTETAHLVFFLILMGYLLYRMQRSRFGRAMTAIRQDEKVATTLGINVVYYKNMAFILGAMIAGVAGGFSGHATRIITPKDYGFDKAVDILAYAVLGGLGHWSGPIIGGMALKAIPERLRYLNEYTGALTGAVLLLIIIYLPSGLVSLGQPSFWRRGGRFEGARRLAGIGVALIVLTNMLPLRNLGSDEVLLGLEYWHLWGLGAGVGLIYWITSRQPASTGGRFSLPMSAVTGLLALGLIIAGLIGRIDQPGDGYYVLVFGLLLATAAGVIPYAPQHTETPPAEQVEGSHA
ncbi:MAG: branched-chain amino acid ABC transporter permease [Chloroflexi bacterium]|nr:branched-chain amino acid ABC transporter permease [Chloroflexota bacterium]